MTLREQYDKCEPRFCRGCGHELKNGYCFCYNVQNEIEQYDEFTGEPLEDLDEE